MDYLFEPFKYEFFRNASIASLFIGVLCGLLGVYIVLRGMSYIGHGLSHAIFGGAAVALVMKWNFYLGAGTWGFLSAVLINQTVRRFKISADAAIGIITTASFALGVAIVSRQHRFTQDLEATLFGSILGVTPEQLIGVIIVTFLVGLAVFLLYRQLLFTTFDEETARAYGIRTQWIDTFFSLALAAAIIVSMQVIGVTLIAAAIVIPPITARLLTDRVDRMILLSMAIGSLTGLVGMYLSYRIDTSSGATIVLTQAACFLIALTANALRRRNRLAAIHYHM
jgi:manganese/iron transport system permease protein/iron/zinc/copper transport system permease protein